MCECVIILFLFLHFWLEFLVLICPLDKKPNPKDIRLESKNKLTTTTTNEREEEQKKIE